MKRGLLVFLAICAFAIAMVPKERRAVNTEVTEVPKQDIQLTEVPKKDMLLCDRYTPCAWSVYTQDENNIQFNITNTYCICASDTICVKDENDPRASALVLRCRKPGSGEKKTDH